HVYSPAMLLVSPDFWNSLSDEDKEVFKKGAAEAVVAMRAFVDEVEKSGVEQLKKEGMTVGELTAEQKAEFQKALAPAYEEYYKTYGKEWIDGTVNAKERRRHDPEPGGPASCRPCRLRRALSLQKLENACVGANKWALILLLGA